MIDVSSLHVATWIEAQMQAGQSAPSVKQRLAAIRHLFDWLVVGHIVPTNPASSVRARAIRSAPAKTPVLETDEAPTLLDSIDASTPAGLRDRALIALMAYSFARIVAVIAMNVEDVFVQRGRLWVRLHGKGGKDHDMPCHHNLEEYLSAYLDGCGLRDDPKGPLFRTIPRWKGQMTPANVAARRVPYDRATVSRRRHREKGGEPLVPGNRHHRLSLTAACSRKRPVWRTHASTRTTQLYDRRRDEMSLDEVERIGI